eukprot:TRINITY_DN158_c0_g2_i1.p2 TRINITY_DN158_c0_g2~~TRINITY_DN158_c0_g2_i1.p2  ORF type:complete len:142 (+),score=47.86 TRINITY_DN158_c0_g2_i1:64-489(+)
MSSGVAVNDACVQKYEQIKMKKDLRYIIFSIKDKKEIIVSEHEAGTDKTWDDFKKVIQDNFLAIPCYALVDVAYTSDDGRDQAKLTFVAWSPDDCGVKEKMLYASSKDAIKKKFPGVMKELQANDLGDLEWSNVEELMKKK